MSEHEQPVIDVPKEKSFSKGSFRPSLVPAAWISASTCAGSGDVLHTTDTNDDSTESERKTQDVLEGEDSVEFGTLSPDVRDQTEEDVAFYFLANDSAADTPFREFQKNEFLQNGSTCSMREDSLNISDDNRTPFTKLQICKDTAEKPTLHHDFMSELEEFPEASPPILTTTDHSTIQSPVPTTKRDASSLTAEEVTAGVVALLENDQDMLHFTTKQWMEAVAMHLDVESLPKQWKSTVKDVLLERGEVCVHVCVCVLYICLE